MQGKPYVITILAYDQVDLLDVAAPHEVFGWMSQLEASPPGGAPRVVQLVSVDGASVRTRDRLQLGGDLPGLEQAPACDLLWIPGGDPARLAELMLDQRLMDFLRRQSQGAQYVASVCEGALLAAAAGLLDGYRATTHWAFVECLRGFPAIEVAPYFPRYVVDRDRITGGGISSGLDESLQIVAMLAGEELARQVQLTIQYNPAPPFHDGDPSVTALPQEAASCAPALVKAIRQITAQPAADSRKT